RHGSWLPAGHLPQRSTADLRCSRIAASARRLPHTAGWRVLSGGSMPSAGSAHAAVHAAPRRIGVVEDHRVTIAGLRQILAEEPSVRIVADAPSVPELLAITDDLDLVILDLRLPDGSSPATNVQQLRAAGI